MYVLDWTNDTFFGIRSRINGCGPVAILISYIDQLCIDLEEVLSYESMSFKQLDVNRRVKLFQD